MWHWLYFLHPSNLTIFFTYVRWVVPLPRNGHHQDFGTLQWDTKLNLEKCHYYCWRGTRQTIQAKSNLGISPTWGPGLDRESHSQIKPTFTSNLQGQQFAAEWLGGWWKDEFCWDVRVRILGCGKETPPLRCHSGGLLQWNLWGWLIGTMYAYRCRKGGWCVERGFGLLVGFVTWDLGKDKNQVGAIRLQEVMVWMEYFWCEKKQIFGAIPLPQKNQKKFLA